MRIEINPKIRIVRIMAAYTYDPSPLAPTKLQELQPGVNVEVAKLILERLGEGVLFVDLGGKLLECNGSAQKILGVGMVQGRLFWEVFADDRLGFSMRESLRYGICHGLVVRDMLEISTAFYYKAPQGLLVLIRDISEKKKLQALIHRSDRMRELGEMAAKLAHEIRNCLGGIRGFATLLLRDLSGQSHLQEMVSRVIEGTKSLEKLVTSVLVYAKPDEISLSTLDLAAHLRQIAKMMKIDPVFPPNVAFELHIPDAPLVISFDPEALKRCLINLLMNGIQAMPNGGTLTLSLFQTGETCQIIVSDTGVGMSEEMLGSLFSPCFTTKKSGNGLGLVEVKKIAQAHGGTVDVRSAAGRGSSFVITLKRRL
jgi:signal transduction histidine kinase